MVAEAPAASPALPTCPSCGQRVYPSELKPGVMLRHRFIKVEHMMVLEIEGEPPNGWFTVRFPDMSTWRMRREEVDVIPGLPEPARPPGQYL